MSADVPPKDLEPRPRYAQLPSGSFLWRVTKQPAPTTGGIVSPFRNFVAEADSRYPGPGGRFDPSSECPYPYCYAAFDDLTAIAEVLLRDVAFGSHDRYLSKHAIKDRRLSILETRRPLWLVSLVDAADLAAAGQDSWLVHTEPSNYRITQRWAHWLRDAVAPDGGGPAGLVWVSKRAPGGRVAMLFGDRCGDSVICSPFGERVFKGTGLDWLNLRLSLLRTKVHP